MSFLSLVVLVGGKYFIRNFSVDSAYVDIESGGNVFSHALALFLKEYENNLRQIASSVTPESLKESLTSIKSQV